MTTTQRQRRSLCEPTTGFRTHCNNLLQHELLQYKPLQHKYPLAPITHLHDVWVAERAADGCLHDGHLLSLLLPTHHSWQHDGLDSHHGALPQPLAHLQE